MLQIPPMPTWQSLHPLIVHFPIVLLLVCPIFILVSAILPVSRARPYMAAAILVLLMGTASLFLSVATGEAERTLADKGGAVSAVLRSHENLARETRVMFSGLSVILLGIFLPQLFERNGTRLSSTVLPLAFLALYSAGLLFLVNTAHAGARLVHEFGVHAPMRATDSLSPSAERDITK